MQNASNKITSYPLEESCGFIWETRKNHSKLQRDASWQSHAAFASMSIVSGLLRGLWELGAELITDLRRLVEPSRLTGEPTPQTYGVGIGLFHASEVANPGSGDGGLLE